MNETFDIEESTELADILIVNPQQVKLRPPTNKPAALFDDIDETKQRRSILSFENNFDLMQTGAYTTSSEHSQGVIAAANDAQMEFLENELIPDELLDDVYNFSETGSTLNASAANSNNTSTKKTAYLSRKSNSLNNLSQTQNFAKIAEQARTGHAFSKGAEENEDLDWLSSQIRALETSLTIPACIGLKQVDMRQAMEQEETSLKLESVRASFKSSMFVDDQEEEEVKYILSELVENVCQLKTASRQNISFKRSHETVFIGKLRFFIVSNETN